MWCREMTRGDNHIVKLLGIDAVFVVIMDGDIEQLFLLVPLHHAHRRIEAHPLSHFGFVNAALDIVEQNFTRRERWNGFAEMFFERVICKFQAFFRAVGPQITIHGTMHWLTILIKTRAPGIVPKPTPIRLLFKANNFRNLGFLFCR